MGIEVHSRVGRRAELDDYCKHVVADAYFEAMDVLEAYSIDPATMVEELSKTIEKFGGNIISHQYHIFGNHYDGAFTIVFMLKESHVSIHTWPENRYAAIDVFTCGSSADPIKMIQEIVYVLDAVDTEMFILTRGPFLSI